MKFTSSMRDFFGGEAARLSLSSEAKFVSSGSTRNSLGGEVTAGAVDETAEPTCSLGCSASDALSLVGFAGGAFSLAGISGDALDTAASIALASPTSGGGEGGCP